jgi:hypothetical protein
MYFGGGVTEKWVKRRVYSPADDPDHLPSIKIGKRRLINPDAIDALIARKARGE